MEERLDVDGHGTRADFEFGGDGLVREAFYEKVQYLLLRPGNRGGVENWSRCFLQGCGGQAGPVQQMRLALIQVHGGSAFLALAQC